MSHHHQLRDVGGCAVRACGGTLSGPSKFCGRHEPLWDEAPERKTCEAVLELIAKEVEALSESAFSARIAREEAGA